MTGISGCKSLVRDFRGAGVLSFWGIDVKDNPLWPSEIILAERRFMDNKKAVYIAGPYTKGDTMINIASAITAAEALSEAGFEYYLPHLTGFHHFFVAHPYKYWMEHSLYWLDRCHYLLRLPGESHGADIEVEHAKSNGIPVYHSVEELINAVTC